MKKSILTSLILFVLYNPCIAQVIFNNPYNDSQNLNDDAVSILKLGNGGYLLGGSIFTNGLNAAQLYKLKNTGDTSWIKYYDLTSYGDRINCVIYASDSNYIMSGSTQDTSGLHRAAFIMKTDTAGNIIWWNRYGGFYNEVGQDVKQTKDGGYIMAGWTSSNTIQPNPNLYEDGYVVKIDSSGNLEWQKQFGDSASDVFYSVDTTSDGGYVFGGRTFSYGANGELWIVKTDSAGDFQWQKNFGGPNIDFGKKAIQTLDGGYMISGSYQTVFLGDKNGYVVKTDSTGNMQWDKQINFSAYSTFEGLVQAPDSNYYLSGSVDYNNFEGILVKLSPSGDSLWSKTYRHFPISNQSQHYFYGMQLLSNNYIAMFGMATTMNLADAWLVIADSMGCADSSCLSTGISTLQAESSGFEIYPNPCDDKLIFITNEIIPGDKINYYVYDVNGKEVKSQSLLHKKQGNLILTDDLNPGIYFLKIHSLLGGRSKTFVKM